MDDLVAFGWDKFIQSFEGFNLEFAQEFSKTFNDTKVKISDLQLEVSEDSIAEATGWSREGDRWFKNLKFEGIPWHLLLVSKRARYDVKGTTIVLFKPRWHVLSLILKQFYLLLYLLKSLQTMPRFYQRKNLNAQSNLSHHGLIRMLVISQLPKVGDNWQDFVDRNGFSPLTPATIIDSPMCFDDPSSPLPSTHSLRDLHVELQEDPVSFTKTPVDFHKSSRGTHQRCDFFPKKSLEDVLDNLKGKVLAVPSHWKYVVDLNEIKTKKRGRHKTRRVLDIDFMNKISSRLLYKMVRNRHHNREKPIPFIDVEDHISVDDTSADVPQYDFISNFPPFLKEQESFSDI
jgi:hypothetical protein